MPQVVLFMEVIKSYPIKKLVLLVTQLVFYTATKKSSRLMAHCYSNLYSIPATGLRFFTVYGPWGEARYGPNNIRKSNKK